MQSSDWNHEKDLERTRNAGYGLCHFCNTDVGVSKILPVGVRAWPIIILLDEIIIKVYEFSRCTVNDGDKKEP